MILMKRVKLWKKNLIDKLNILVSSHLTHLAFQTEIFLEQFSPFVSFCPRNITLGFELMKQKESADNLFRVVTTRDLDLDKLKLISFDDACTLNTYALNREAREFEYIKTVVDTVHWKNHTSCSRGFDSRFYKNTIISNMNSQSREQTNSKLAKLKPSLRQMNYQSFMVMTKVFFRINNLKANGILG